MWKKSTSAYYLAVPQKKANFEPVLRFRDWLLDQVARFVAENKSDISVK